VPLFTEIIEAVADFIAVDPYCMDSGIAVVAASEKKKLRELQIQIENRINLCAVVTFGGARANHNNIPGPYFDEVDIEIQVCENRNINNTGKDAEGLAARVAQIVEDFRIAETASLGCNRDFIFLSMAPIQLPQQFNYLYALSLQFRTGAGERYQPNRVETPVITVNGIQVESITCATAGASIYYTTDSSYPRPAVGTSAAQGAVYGGGTIDLNPGETIRARAFKTGLRASIIAEETA
jgi:hypothetical protein